jgi:hypothetical protein
MLPETGFVIVSGLPGSGKSTLGRAIAAAFGWRRIVRSALPLPRSSGRVAARRARVVRSPASPPEPAMIKGMHAMFYSSQADALRAFLRDRLGLKATDVGGGWLIFDAPEADLGVHPTEGGDDPPSGTADISFYCDDIEQTVAELRARGVEFTQAVEDHGYGLVTYFKVPGDFKVQLYQPRYDKRA